MGGTGSWFLPSGCFQRKLCRCRGEGEAYLQAPLSATLESPGESEPHLGEVVLSTPAHFDVLASAYVNFTLLVSLDPRRVFLLKPIEVLYFLKKKKGQRAFLGAVEHLVTFE